MLQGRMRPKENPATQFIRLLLLQMNEQERDAFFRRLAEDYPPDIQLKLYAFTRGMLCAWAGQTDLSREDARVIEESRKICDIMGWPVAK